MAPPANTARPMYVLPADNGGPANEADRISLSAVARYLWVCRIWILVFGLLGLGAGIGAFEISTKIYHSETLLTAAQTDRSNSALGSLASQFGGAASMIGLSMNGANSSRTEALTVLRSPGFVRYFIQRHNLMPILYSRIWDADAKTWKVSDPAKIPTLSDAVQYFSTRVLEVQDDKLTGIVTVAVEWRDRFVAAEWANGLVSDLNEALRTRAVQESSASIDYLNRVLTKGNVPEMEQQAIYNLIEGQMATSTMANVRQQYALKVLDVAVPADADRYVKPNLLLLVAGGTFSSIVFGLLFRYLFGERLLALWHRLRARDSVIATPSGQHTMG